MPKEPNPILNNSSCADATVKTSGIIIDKPKQNMKIINPINTFSIFMIHYP